MSLHNNPKYQIPALVDALKQHGLKHNSPSQLADAFRTGWVAALATPAQAAAPDMTDAYAGAREDLSIWKKRALEAEALNRKFAASVNSPSFMGEPAALAQAGEYPAGTGNPEADRIIQRLASSDPDFDDCADATALIFKLVAEHKGPDGYATWKDVAVAERVRRVEVERIRGEVEPLELPRHRFCLNSNPVMPGYTAEEMLAYRAARGAAKAAPVEAQHSTACLYHYALSRLGLRDNTGLRVLFWDAHNSLSWDSKTDWYVTPDADEADCGLCNAARAAQEKP